MKNRFSAALDGQRLLCLFTHRVHNTFSLFLKVIIILYVYAWEFSSLNEQLPYSFKFVLRELHFKI